MTITETFPPNYDDIKAALPAVADEKAAVFTYGDTLHNPHKTDVLPHLRVHEAVHAQRQKDPDAWWKQYLSDPAFRLEEELAAFSAQYHFTRSILSAKKQKTVLTYLARDLSSEAYGNLLDYSKAEMLIKRAEHALA